MPSNIEKYKTELSKLLNLGKAMDADLFVRNQEKREKLDEEREKLLEELAGTFERQYQKWYSQSQAVIRQLLPERLDEFEILYKGDLRRKAVDETNCTIQDWLMGVRAKSELGFGTKLFNDIAIVTMRFRIQLEILRSLEPRFESVLFDIKQLVQADLFDSELDSARELLKNKFLRGAGAVAGVVLEKHLAEVCGSHKIVVRKKAPTINDFIEQLKSNDVIDTPVWRNIQRLGDLRNLCDHNKNRDPKAEEVTELIDGVDKVTKTLF